MFKTRLLSVIAVFLFLHKCNACPEGYFNQCVQCPPEFIELHKGCYYFSNKTGPWIDGVKFCGNYNSHLVDINSEQESLAINLHIYHKHTISQVGYWTSGSDMYKSREFIWMNQGKVFSYTNWCDGEPNNASGGNENCVHIHFRKGKSCWNDLHCSKSTAHIGGIAGPLYFICEYQPEIVIE